jgi:hypothetical protein
VSGYEWSSGWVVEFSDSVLEGAGDGSWLGIASSGRGGAGVGSGRREMRPVIRGESGQGLGESDLHSGRTVSYRVQVEWKSRQSREIVFRHFASKKVGVGRMLCIYS